jgi:flagellar biosynthesis regulator FlaF
LATTAIATSTAAATATVAAPATTVAAAAATIAATAVSAATSAASAPAGWARFTWSRFVHGQGPAFDRLAIELRDCLLSIRFGRHRDKREAARLTGELILHQRDLLHWPRLSEKILQICFGRVEGKISYV